jgi:hypothetical protein
VAESRLSENALVLLIVAAVIKATVRVESAMLATTTPDHLIEEVKEHMVFFRKLALGNTIARSTSSA